MRHLLQLQCAPVHPISLQLYMAPCPYFGHRGYVPEPLANVVMDHVDYWRELAALVYYKARSFI